MLYFNYHLILNVRELQPLPVSCLEVSCLKITNIGISYFKK